MAALGGRSQAACWLVLAGAASGSEFGDGLTVEAAHRACADWATQLGERLPDGQTPTLVDTHGPQWAYRFVTDTGTGSLRIAGLSGRFICWVDLAIAHERHDGRVVGPKFTGNRLEVADRWLRRHRPEALGPSWRWQYDCRSQCLPDGTYAGRAIRVQIDEAGRVWRVTEWFVKCPLREPAKVSPAQAFSLARKWLAAWPGIDLATLEHTGALAPERPDVSVLMVDAYGAERRVYPLAAMPLPRAPTPPDVSEGALVSVDAATGEVVPEPLMEFALGGYTSGWPRHGFAGLRVRNYAVDLAYPVRVQAGRAFLWAGYLASGLWGGAVQQDGPTLAGEYRGRRFHCRLGSATMEMDDQQVEMKAAPLVVDGQWYLPLPALAAITRWALVYDAPNGEVVATGPDEPDGTRPR